MADIESHYKVEREFGCAIFDDASYAGMGNNFNTFYELKYLVD